jgi:hypothetical protein
LSPNANQWCDRKLNRKSMYKTKQTAENGVL